MRDEMSLTDPERQAGRGNQWYCGDQLREQLGEPGPASMVLGRWKHFERVIEERFGGTIRQTPVRVLDAGCGDGINLIGLQRAFARLSIPVELVAADYNFLRVTRALRIEGVVSFVVASVLALPFARETFDVVVCNHVLEHVADDGVAMANVEAVLREGGLLLAGLPNEGCLLGKLRNRVFQREILATTDHVHFHTRRSAMTLMESARLETIAIDRQGFFTPHMGVHVRLTKTRVGRRLLAGLGRAFPSQASDLLIVAVKPSSNQSDLVPPVSQKGMARGV